MSAISTALILKWIFVAPALNAVFVDEVLAFLTALQEVTIQHPCTG